MPAGRCPTCHGKRYSPETLEVHYRGRSIADVLEMTVDAALAFLADVRAAARSLEMLRDVGLGYLRLGQPATELSGDEAQRIKLATELQRGRYGHALYLLDEPTTGCTPPTSTDWVIDLGPGAGDDGGRVVAAGPPHEVARAEESRTAPYLAGRLEESERAAVA
jgi:excinuclease ABC subunit A